MDKNLIDIIIKIFFINIFTYFVAFKSIKYKLNGFYQFVKTIIACIVTTGIYIFVKIYIDDNIFTTIMISYVMQVLFLMWIMKEKNRSLFIVNFIANAITYTTIVLAMIIELIFRNIFNLENNITINIILIMVLETILLVSFFRLNRFKNGFSFLQSKINDDYIDIIMITISAVVIFVYCLLGNYYGNLTKHILISFIILTVIMLIMIQKTLTLYYKQKLLAKTIEEYKDSIAQKDAKIKQLSDEKFAISKLNHEFYNRQKAMEYKVQELINNGNFNIEAASELSVIDEINSLTKQYSNKLEEIKKLDKLPLTDIVKIDDMFKYMQSECAKNGIDFKLQINGNINHMISKIVSEDRLVTLIGDHIRDAIIAVNSGNNNYKSIIATLGIKDNVYEFCVYDSGIEFEIDTLLNLGIKPITTHKNTGGTGIGFITTFETLKETNGSLIIEEMHEMANNDYTKAVIIRFDRKNEYKIRSYRADKIKDKIKDDRIIIEDY